MIEKKKMKIYTTDLNIFILLRYIIYQWSDSLLEIVTVGNCSFRKVHFFNETLLFGDIELDLDSLINIL